MVERAVADGAAKVTAAAPRPVSFRDRLGPPILLAEYRLVKRKTPIPLDSSLLGEKDKMMRRLARERERTHALLTDTRQCDLRQYFWKHPFFGHLNFYQWMRLLAHHQVRHTKQIREIVNTFHR